MTKDMSYLELEHTVEDTQVWLQRLQYDANTPFLWQTLIIFPTVRSLHQHLQWWCMDLTWSVVLHGQLHASARAKAFWDIKSWAIHTIYATYSQVFRDWNDLKKIILIDQHAWWYKNYQEPRYFAPTVIDQIMQTWWCEIVKTGEIIENT
jgi:primosomal protein N'